MANNFSQSPFVFNSPALAGTGVIQTQDTTLFDTVSVIVVGVTVSTTLAEVSNDNGVSWTAIAVIDKTVANPPGARIIAATGITGPGVYQFSLPFGQFRLRCSAYTSGSPVFNLFYAPSDIQP